MTPTGKSQLVVLLLLQSSLLLRDCCGFQLLLRLKTGSSHRRQIGTLRSSLSFSSTDSAASSNEDAGSEKVSLEERERTLYDVLGANMNDSRSELKRKYVILAKQCHPDAIFSDERRPETADFSEIAAAWQILSDKRERQRYNRKIRAEALSRDLQKSMEEFTEAAAPQVRDIFDNVAMPFLRRTTATTLASIQSAAHELSHREDQTKAADLGTVFSGAMDAAKRAGELVDNVELLEKSELLEKGLLVQIEEASKIKSKLENVTMQRVEASLDTINVTFLSTDAVSLLKHWNISTDRSLLGLKLGNPVDNIIQELNTVESSLANKTIELESAILQYQQTEKNLQNARAERVLALQSEKQAREALRQAKRRVANSKQQINVNSKYLSRAELEVKKVADEREHVAKICMKKQNNLRHAMRKRKASISSEKNKEESMKDWETLQQEEQALLNEYNALESEAKRLQAKANELKERAEQLSKKQ